MFAKYILLSANGAIALQSAQEGMRIDPCYGRIDGEPTWSNAILDWCHGKPTEKPTWSNALVTLDQYHEYGADPYRGRQLITGLLQGLLKALTRNNILKTDDRLDFDRIDLPPKTKPLTPDELDKALQPDYWSFLRYYDRGALVYHKDHGYGRVHRRHGDEIVIKYKGPQDSQNQSDFNGDEYQYSRDEWETEGLQIIEMKQRLQLDGESKIVPGQSWQAAHSLAKYYTRSVFFDSKDNVLSKKTQFFSGVLKGLLIALIHNGFIAADELIDFTAFEPTAERICQHETNGSDWKLLRIQFDALGKANVAGAHDKMKEFHETSISSRSNSDGPDTHELLTEHFRTIASAFHGLLKLLFKKDILSPQDVLMVDADPVNSTVQVAKVDTPLSKL